MYTVINQTKRRELVKMLNEKFKAELKARIMKEYGAYIEEQYHNELDVNADSLENRIIDDLTSSLEYQGNSVNDFLIDSLVEALQDLNIVYEIIQELQELNR